MARCSAEALVEARMSRRMHAEDRYLGRMEKREAAAEKMVGELCREGRPVFYVFPDGGKYREGGFFDLVQFLLRNNYA